MDLSISEQQEILLYKAVKDYDGVVSISLAKSMYSSSTTAKKAIDKLKLAGYIEYKTPGYWDVVKVTQDVKEEIKHEDKDVDVENSEGGGSIGSRDSGSEYEMTKVS